MKIFEALVGLLGVLGVALAAPSGPDQKPTDREEPFTRRQHTGWKVVTYPQSNCRGVAHTYMASPQAKNIECHINEKLVSYKTEQLNMVDKKCRIYTSTTSTCFSDRPTPKNVYYSWNGWSSGDGICYNAKYWGANARAFQVVCDDEINARFDEVEEHGIWINDSPDGW